MKKARSLKYYCRAALLILFVLMSSNASLARGYEQISEPQSMSMDMKKPAMSYNSFERYQQTMDDLFEIAFALPQDGEGGLNNMIINLNRKVAENPSDVDSIVSLGHIYRILKQPAEANRFYQKAIDVASDHAHLHCFSALMFYQLRKYDAAIEELGAAVEADGEDVHAWLARGRAFVRVGNYEGAISDFNTALELMPENHAARMLLGQLYEMNGNTDEAYQIFKSVSEAEAENEVAQFNLAIMKLRKNEAAEGVKLLENIFLEGERDLDFLLQLSMAYMDNKEFEKALKILEVLRFLFPEKVALDLFQAEAHRNLREFDEAAQIFRMLLAQEPDHVDSYVGLAITMAETGDLNEGLKVIDEGLMRMQGDKRLLKWKEKLSKEYENN